MSAPRTRQRAPDARREILDIAAGMMRRHGYAETSMRDLAAEVGMQTASLYYHFPSKDALATEVMRRGVEVVSRAVAEALVEMDDLSPRQRVVKAMEVHLQSLLSSSDYASAHIRCFPFVPDGIRKELAAVRRDYDRVWDTVLRDFLGADASPTEIRYLRYALIGALNWSLEWFDPRRDSVSRYVASLKPLLARR